MYELLELLALKGFKPTSGTLNFSTMSNLRYVVSKDDLDIYFGLNAVGKPPTLIYPRPKIESYLNVSTGGKKPKVIKGYKTCEKWDDNMNNAFLNYSAQDILNAMFDKSKKLTLA